MDVGNDKAAKLARWLITSFILFVFLSLPTSALAVDLPRGGDQIPDAGDPSNLMTNRNEFSFNLPLLADILQPPSASETPLAPAADDVDTLNVAFDVETTLDLSWGWGFFAEDPSVYNHDLAKVGLLLCQAAKTSQVDVEARLRDFGFENIRSEYYDNALSLHNPASTFASRAVTLDGETKVVVAIVVRGTSNAGDVFTDLAAQFNGFADSAENVSERFAIYFNHLSAFYDFDVGIDNTILFITGHSLGGAVAGQLATLLEEESGQRETIFTYAFAAPSYETADGREAYTNIHNIINVQDPWPYLPFGFKKNGHCWYYDSADGRYQTALDTIYGTSDWKARSIEDRHDPPTYLAMLLTGLPTNMDDTAPTEN